MEWGLGIRPRGEEQGGILGMEVEALVTHAAKLESLRSLGVVRIRAWLIGINFRGR